jgi:energy-coupling factor transporter transmembrane protein EcfT
MYGGSGWGPNDGISFYLGTGQLFGVLLLIFVLASQVYRIFKHQEFNWSKNFNLVLIGIGVTGFSLFMSLEKTSKIWQTISILALAQFPWRWLATAIIGMTILVAALPAFLPKKWWRSLLLALVWLVIVVGSTSDFRPESYLKETEGYYYTQPAKIQSAMSDILPDYIPIQMAKNLTPPQNLWLNLDLTKNIEVLINRTQEKLIKLKSATPVKLDIALADFSSWQVEIDGQTVAKNQGVLGNIQVTVPAGEHFVGVVWVGSQIENLSNYISLISLILLISMGVYKIQNQPLTTKKI